MPVPHQLFRAVHPAAVETLVSTKVTMASNRVTVSTFKVGGMYVGAVKVGIPGIGMPPIVGAAKVGAI